MSQFITLEDYDASIHREILDALVRQDETVIEICEDRAVAQMRSYLSRRYDCNRIFAARADKRHQLILMMALDIAIYHICSIHNPNTIKGIRKERYDAAREWMKAVAAEEISIDGAPLLPEETRRRNANFLFKSNPKRVNHL